MSTSSKSGKGVSGGSDDGSVKIGTGGNEPPKDQAPGTSKGADKKKRPSKG